MDYEKLYNEALERAKQFHKKELFAECNGRLVEYIFPELKESEDERIRKEIIDYIKIGTYHKDWLTWLEKQGEQKVSYTTTVETGDGGINALVTKDIEIPFGAKDSELQEVSYYIPKGYYAYIDDDKVIIKKRGKSKFKVGDWIMDKESKEVFYISKNLANTYKIVDIEGNDYHVPHYILEEDYEVWAIQDAKDGDVLVDVYGNIGIFEKRYGINWHTYCYLGCEGRFISEGGSHGSICYPATKEQREQLEKAMADAGYEWDAEKKELKHDENE